MLAFNKAESGSGVSCSSFARSESTPLVFGLSRLGASLLVSDHANSGLALPLRGCA